MGEVNKMTASELEKGVCTAVDNDVTRKIIRQIYEIIYKKLNDIELMSIVGSWGDTLDDDQILELLTDYNQQLCGEKEK
jgi:hypothetical protein